MTSLSQTTWAIVPDVGHAEMRIIFSTAFMMKVTVTTTMTNPGRVVRKQATRWIEQAIREVFNNVSLQQGREIFLGSIFS